ncbi:MAG: CARDB domain-containing protein [Candidatus Bathyarchaeia archaeon]
MKIAIVLASIMILLAGLLVNFCRDTFWLDEALSFGVGETKKVLVQNSIVEWNQTYGGSQLDVAYWVHETGDGGYAIVGWTGSFSIGSSDFWLIKTDAYGNTLWNRTYGGTYADMAYSAQQTSDGGYIMAGRTAVFIPEIGALRDDFLLVKVDSEGNVKWNKTCGGQDWDLAYSVQQTSDGGYAVAGWTRSFGAGNYDAWLVKVDAYGNMEWNKTYGDALFQEAWDVKQTSDTGYIMAGYTSAVGQMEDFWLVKVDAYGNMEWNKTYGGAESDFASYVLQTSDGGYIVIGSTKSFGSGEYDAWLVKVDAYGNMEWNKTYGGSQDDVGCEIQKTFDGGYIIAGKTKSIGSGEYDAWLVKVDAYGNMEWNKAFGGVGSEGALSVQQTSDGGYVAAGYTYSYGAGKSDFWVVKVMPFHDVSIANVSPSKTVLGQGWDFLTINVSVANLGYFTETFNVTVYYDSNPIGTQTVSNLAPDNIKTITFLWNATNIALGNYTISAYASPISGERNAENNHYVNGMVEVKVIICDIAIADVHLEKTLVGEGYRLKISVTVQNNGDITETFHLTLYANTTTIGTYELTITGKNSTTVIICWHPSGLTKGNYTITAYIPPVRGETEEANNNYINGWVCIVTPGDADADGDIDIYDVVLITSTYGSTIGQPNYNPNVDWLDDGVINIYDIVIATSRYGEKDP